MSKENTKEEEKVIEPSKEEEKVEEPSEPIGAKEAADQFYKEQAEAEKEKPSEKEAETKPEEKVSEEEVSEEKPVEPSLFIVDEKGEKTPLIFKANGKEIAPSEVEKVKTYLSLGVHANTVVEEAKKKTEEFEKAEPILNMLLDAYKQNKLSVEGKLISPSKEEKVEEEPEEEEDVTKDPELSKAESRIKALEDTQLKSFMDKQKGKIDSEITEHRKTNFAAIVRSDEDSPKEVWDLLAEQNDAKTGPKYTVEEALKKSHELNIANAKKLFKENPKEFEVDEDAIYAKKLKEKQEKEEAPVSAPSEAPAVVETKPGEMEFEGPAEAYKAFVKQHKSKQEASRKS